MATRRGCHGRRQDLQVLFDGRLKGGVEKTEVLKKGAESTEEALHQF